MYVSDGHEIYWVIKLYNDLPPKNLIQRFNCSYSKRFIYKVTQNRMLITGYKLISLINSGIAISWKRCSHLEMMLNKQ